MNEPFNGEPQAPHNGPQGNYPPKPQLIEKNQNALVRSLISLFVYALLFYLLFEQNVAYIAAILLVIIVHELGHFTFMKLFNYSNVKIFIVPLLGALTSGKKQVVSQWQLAVVILAGPLPGIIIGSVLYWFNLDLKNETLSMLANSFLVINLLNLLPFHPLDGGRLLETLFFKENHLIRMIFGVISIIALVIIFLSLNSLVLLIIPALITLELYNEKKHQKIRDYLKQERINYHTDYANLPDKDYWLIRDCLILSFPKKFVGVVAGRHEYHMVEPIVIQQINAVLQVNLNADLSILKRLLVLFFYFFILVAPLMMIYANK